MALLLKSPFHVWDLNSRINVWPESRKVCICNRKRMNAVGASNGNEEQFIDDKDELAAKLAAAEAQAQALRIELASRTGRDVDLSKIKPAIPQKRIDGIGYRETIMSVSDEKSTKWGWGLTESDLLSESVDQAVQSPQEKEKEEEEDDGDRVVYRRLVLGVGFAAIAIGLAFVKFPTGLVKPSKPLFYYLVRILRLKKRLEQIQVSEADAISVVQQLKEISNSSEEMKDNLLGAAGWLEEEDAEKASSLAYIIYGYLKQADFRNYFDNQSQISYSQKLEFLRFSLQSVEAALQNIQSFLLLVPKESLREVESPNT